MLETFIKITGLALADSVNPCAIAVLTMVLVSILIANPENKKKVLQTGLTFSLAVFLGYLIYSGIIVQFFKTFETFLRINSIYVFKGLGILAMILGALNIKDSIFYKKGSLGTEMPLFMRPKVKKITKKITSPKGAFSLGFIITLFLLPCTMGPLFIASGALSQLNYLAIALWLIYYNILFILPMIAITLIVYFGFGEIEEVSGWKERNIRKLHLIAGTLLFLIGFALINGWL